MGLKASQFTKSNSTFIKGDDVKGAPMTQVIEAVEAAETPDGKPALQLSFKSGKKLTLNKTNTRILAGMIGDDTDQWLGAKLGIRFDPTVMFSGKMVGGIRVEVIGQAGAPDARAVDVDDDLAF